MQNPKRVVTIKRMRKVGAITSAEEGQLVTLVYSICANGNVVPPMFIFSWKNCRDYFVCDRPQGCIKKAAPSG